MALSDFDDSCRDHALLLIGRSRIRTSECQIRLLRRPPAHAVCLHCHLVHLPTLLATVLVGAFETRGFNLAPWSHATADLSRHGIVAAASGRDFRNCRASCKQQRSACDEGAFNFFHFRGLSVRRPVCTARWIIRVATGASNYRSSRKTRYRPKKNCAHLPLACFPKADGTMCGASSRGESIVPSTETQRTPRCWRRRRGNAHRQRPRLSRLL
jgi:hypothetical protein